MSTNTEKSILIFLNMNILFYLSSWNGYKDFAYTYICGVIYIIRINAKSCNGGQRICTRLNCFYHSLKLTHCHEEFQYF